MQILRVQMLGGLRLAYTDARITALSSPRLQSLFARLVLQAGVPQPRAQLAFSLFPDTSDAQAHTNLRNLIHRLRRALPDPDRFLDSGGPALLWRPDAPYTLDVAEFESALQGPRRLAAIEHAMSLYAGDLLPGLYDDWIEAERERLRLGFAGLLEAAIALLEGEGDYTAALRYARRLVEHDPLHEPAYRDLIRLHALAGDRGGARRAYEACVRVVRRELGAEPSEDTRELYERVAQGGVPPRDPRAATPEYAPPAHPNNLPAYPTSLIGREREVAAVRSLLGREGVRLLTLTGPGGAGKTRLALRAAEDLLPQFDGGVFFVPLAPVSDPHLVASAIARALGVREDPDAPLAESLKAHLRTRRALLLLDNFEQVLPAALLLSELLAAAPRLKLLVTSRERLRLYGEHEYMAPPLTLPVRGGLGTEDSGLSGVRGEPSGHPADAARGIGSRVTTPGGESARTQSSVLSPESYGEAVALFVERARAVEPGFELTGENAAAVAGICARLDGLPLAIELAAARADLLSPREMLPMLDKRLALLTGGAVDLPDRHRTMRAAIGWSYDLLSGPERALFARLAVFAGGCTPATASAVCGIEGDVHVPRTLSSLLDKNLLHQVDGADGEPRYTMLETIREYALEKLEASGQAEDQRRRHAEYYLALAEEAEPELVGPRQEAWFRRLRAEHENIRAALGWSLRAGEGELGLRLAAALQWFWFVSDFLSEGRRWLETTLASGGASPASLRAKALNGVGLLAFTQYDLERATAALEESLRLRRSLRDRKGTAESLRNLGWAAYMRGEHAEARALSEEGLALYRELEDPEGVVGTLNTLGVIAWGRADYAGATNLFDEALALSREQGNEFAVAALLNNRAHLAWYRGEHERAGGMFREALAMAREMGAVSSAGCCLEGLGGMAAELGAAARAARLLGAAEALFEALGARSTHPEPDRHERAVAAARTALGEERFAAGWEGGRALTPERAIAYALGEAA